MNLVLSKEAISLETLSFVQDFALLATIMFTNITHLTSHLYFLVVTYIYIESWYVGGKEKKR
jgi:hypothetical protein